MTEGNNPTDKSKTGTKRHILTDENGIPLSTVITSATNTHDIKAVTNVIDNTVLNKSPESSYRKKKTRRKYPQQQHLCLDRAYSSKTVRQQIIKRGYVPHIPYKRKRGQMRKEKIHQKRYSPSKNKRWVVERKQTHDGITGSESCLQDMKRKLRTILDWCTYRAVSSSIER